jgi:mannose/cellobiose epimerase-like protein (N-acyl-D-glucosamine 2-epimerase family)
MTDDAARAAALRGFLGAMVGNWTGPGWDGARGGYHERLGPDLLPTGAAHRRLVLAARQLYLLCRAPGLIGAAIPPGRTETVFRLLADRFRDPRHGGFFFTLDLEGSPLDRRKDLYGHAFALFALAAYHTVNGDPEALALARETQAVLDRHLAVPGGWFASFAAEDWSGRAVALAQNPQMHLLEAYLALEAADGDPIWAARADRLVTLFHQHLYDPQARLLGEFYDETGKPDRATGHLAEPGHQFEWSWLLDAHAARRGTAPPAAASDLIDGAATLGVDPHDGGIWDRIDRSGNVVAPTKRIWPVCEAIKAYAGRWRRGGGEADRARMRHWLDFLPAHYLRPGGCWHEILNQDLTPQLSEMPGTTPYHLLMMAESVLPVLAESAEPTSPSPPFFRGEKDLG